MKKSFKFLSIAILLIIVLMAFVACNDDKDTVVTSLATPENLGANGSTISWSAVEGASSYEIIVDNQEAQTTENVYYRVDISSIGSYTIKVRAVGTNTKGETIYSEYAEFIFTKSKKLAKPTIAAREQTDKTITWAAVENASSYLVVTKNSSGETIHSDYQEATSFTIDGSSYDTVGKYTIQIKAIPDSTKTEYANSDASVAYYVVSKKLSAPTIASVSSTAITWTSISGSVSYKLWVYKEGDTTGKWPKTFQTTSNSYAFSSMGLDDAPATGSDKYYCIIQALGDGEVYLTSNESTRDTNFDLSNVVTIDENTIQYAFNNTTKKWEVTFETENVDLLSSFTITLKTTKADNTSSMPTIQETIWVKEGTFEFTAYTSEDYDAARTYYVKSASDVYVKNTEDFKSGTDYYTFDGKDYTKVENIAYLENAIEYYVKHEANYAGDYYEKAKGEATYTAVATGTIFNTKKDYYIITGGTGVDGDPYVYTLVTSGYVQPSADFKKSSLADEHNSIKYFTSAGVYLGTGSEIKADTSIDNDTLLYVYKSFTSFDTDVDYYVAEYGSFNKATFDATKATTTYYVVSKATFTKAIDDMFFTVDDLGNYTYVKSDLAYYGKNYTITIDADATNNTTITGDDVVVNGEYTSYRKPILIDATTPYDQSKIKGYFVSGTEEENIAEYTAFVTAHDGWYAVDSIGALQYMAYEYDKNYVLMQDLDAEGYYWNTIPYFVGKFDTSDPSKQIGGILDGNNHKIENIVYAPVKVTIGLHEYDYVEGLIAAAQDVVIKDLYILNASNKAEVAAYVGGIVAFAEASDANKVCAIQNCYVNGTFSTAVAIGGMVAMGNDIDMLNCQTNVTINNASVAAGLAAVVSNSDFSNCIALGEISVEDKYISVGDFDSLSAKKYLGTTKIYKYENEEYIYLDTFANKALDSFKDDDGNYYSEYYVNILYMNKDNLESEAYNTYAGLVGAVDHSIINNCVATVEITVNHADAKVAAGGLVGSINYKATINNSYAGNQYSNDTTKRMEMTISGNTTIAGGFVGFASNLDATNCYSTIRVSASDYFGGFVGYAYNSKFVRCFVTGGISRQTADNKAAFVAYDDTSTYTNCYVYDKFNDQAADAKAEEKTLEQILALCNEAQAGSFATIEGYLEPCAIGPVYVSDYTDSIKASEELHIKAYYATYDTTNGTKVINMIENDDMLRIKIGDTSTKGTALVIVQEKVDADNDGVDDGTGRRVVIYVTVS